MHALILIMVALVFLNGCIALKFGGTEHIVNEKKFRGQTVLGKGDTCTFVTNDTQVVTVTVHGVKEGEDPCANFR